MFEGNYERFSARKLKFLSFQDVSISAGLIVALFQSTKVTSFLSFTKAIAILFRAVNKRLTSGKITI